MDLVAAGHRGAMMRRSATTAHHSQPPSDALYQALLDQAADGIFIADASGRFVEVNRRGCELLGTPRADLLSRSWPDLIPNADRADPLGLGDLRPGLSAIRECNLRCTDGRALPVEITTRMLADGNLLSTVRDPSARTRPEGEIQDLEKFPDENPNPVLRIAGDGVVQYANQAGAGVLAGWNCAVGQQLPDHWRALIQETLGAGMPREAETAYGDRVFALALAPIVDGGYVHIYGHDITERKRAEEELKRSNAELEQFAYVASHDLQEPLRAVAGMVQLLQQRYQGQLDERANLYIAHAVEGATRMQTLINDLMAFSRVDPRGRPFAPVNVAAALRPALANLAVAVRESRATITHDELPTVLADSGQLTQLFQNLIGNALKFRGDQPPAIHVGAERLADAWRFSVRDNGIGIEPQYAERIFVVFQRLHTRRAYPGTGIGLAICKKIVERHGGRIWVESEPGRGATFLFTIPHRRDADVR